MEDNRIEEVESEVSEASPEHEAERDTKRQILKYAGVWVALVALFLVSNVIIKSVSSNTSAVANNNAGYYSGGQPAAYGSGENAGSSACGGECCGGPEAAATAPGNPQAGTQAQGSELETIEKAAIEFYAQKTGDREVTAEAKSLGCHHEITIMKDGKVVAELSLMNGQFSSLRPW